MAVAEASLRMVIVSISEGLRRLSGLRGRPAEPPIPIPSASVWAFETAMPSMT
jgi:hypothetical protein